MPVAVAADTSWTVDPGPLSIVVLLGFLYVRRWREVRRSSDKARDAPTWRLASFLAGELLILAALVSPIDALADQLFAMHMVQHVLLLDVVPVLFMLSLTKVLLRPLTRRTQALERAAGPLAHPAFAVAAYVAIMWLWHVPALYDLALDHSGIHAFEHICFTSVGLLYWWHLLSPIRSRMRGGPFAPVVYMLGTKLLVGALGIGITFAPHAIYDFYENGARVWGLSAHDDQQVAGAIMAIEQSIVMGIALAWLFVSALAESDRANERAERLEDASDPVAVSGR